MTVGERTQTLAENTTITVLSRLAMLAMPVLFTIFVWFASDYIKTQRDAVSALANRLDAQTNAQVILASRVTILETSQASGRADRIAFQNQIIADLRDMRGSVNDLAKNVAALTATVQGLKERPSK